MNTLFVLMRVFAGLTSLAALVLIGLVLFLRDAASTAKQGVQVLGYVAQLFATAFTQGTAPPQTGWQISLWQLLICVLAIAMTLSVFTPGSRGYLHGIALLGAVVLGGYVRMFFSGVTMEIVCLPFLLVWFGYYAMTFASFNTTQPVHP